ncbi:maleylpyruvate isomerase N-terminal domain-containing protein, partial [Pseudonocardia lacus]|uniref:maleylpyruvate isomerase N-terminal domain-containing protein n=1 Tax=Pseudonocardia lacus TaxID=2835865 RepID=UPI001BDC6F4B
MTDFIDLAPAARRVADLAAAVPDERLTAPTPCAGVPVAGLLSHLLSLSGAFARAAAKAPDQGPPPAEPPPLPADWRTALP